MLLMGKYLGGYRQYNLNWKGGRILWDGYYYIYKPEHKFANSRGYIAEHRLVWEQEHNCCLLSNSVVHHKSEKKTDNRIENLQAMTRSSHFGLHNKINNTVDMSVRTCLLCLVIGDEVKNKSRKYWYRVVEGFICRKCYYHINYMSK